MRTRRTRLVIVAAAGWLAAAAIAGLAPEPLAVSGATTAALTVNAATPSGTVGTRLSTQLVWPGGIESVPGGLSRLQTLAPPLIRIHAGTDGGYDAVALPLNQPWTIEGRVKPAWDFTLLDSMVNSVKAAGTEPVLNIRYAPDPMYTCPTFGSAGTLRDPTYAEFTDYLANLVRYYNGGGIPSLGIVNPKGAANRVGYWEIWNEPDYTWENPCVGSPGGSPIFTPSSYVTMWNLAAAKMRAVDPTVKLVGPAPSNHPSLVSGTMHDPNDYVPMLLRNATIKPDVISFHGYGGWDNAQSDRLLFDGSDGGGIQAVVDGLADIKSWIAQYAPGTPVWLTETNVSADAGLDSAQRAWNQFSAAWGASLFRRMVLGGMDLIHEFQFSESKQLGLIVPANVTAAGDPLLPYWRDYYLARYFPPGSTLLSATADAGAPEVEILAARQPGGSNVRVLVIDRQVLTGSKGIGLPVTVSLNVQNLARVQSVTMRMLDAGTMSQLLSGPPLVALPASTTQTIAFGGYGAALLEFSSSAPAPTGPVTSSAFMPNLTKTLGGPGGWDTPFIIQNIGSTAADVQLSFYRFSDGSLITQRWVQGLAAGTSYADIPSSDPELPDDTQFSLVVRSYGSRVVTVVNQVQGSGAQLQAASYDGAPSGATTVFLPNVTRRFFGYDTPFIVQNLGTTTTVVRAAFTSFDGTQHLTLSLTVPPGRSGVVDPDFTPSLADGTQYAVVLNADQPIAAVVNAHNESGSPVAYTSSGITAGAPVLYAPYASKSNDPGGVNSPVVVQNMAAVPVDATLRFTPFGGGAVQSFTLMAIGAGASQVLDPRFNLGTTAVCTVASSSCLGAGDYSVQIVATGLVAAVVLPTSDHTADAYAATAAPTSRAYLPNVTRTLGGAAGWTTPIALQSVTATSVTLHWYRFADGGLAATQQLTLPNGGASWIDPRSVAGLADDTQYSVTIDATGGTVTAIVYEILYVDGDGVMIYSGFGG